MNLKQAQTLKNRPHGETFCNCATAPVQIFAKKRGPVSKACDITLACVSVITTGKLHFSYVHSFLH